MEEKAKFARGICGKQAFSTTDRRAGQEPFRTCLHFQCMQVCTCMKSTEQRILDAAMRVFARDGVSGATTREIARVARVNEVTLFRHFRSKDELLRQMVVRSCQRYREIFAGAAVGTPADLRRTVRDYAEMHAQRLYDNEDLVRTFMGELKRH